MNSPALGLNWMRYHPDNRVDFDHINRVGYRWLLLYEWMWGDRGFCQELLAAVGGDCSFILRDHPLSEQKADMYRGARGTGARHGREWAQKWKEGRVFIPKDRCWVQGINEPDSNHAEVEIDEYTEEFARTLASAGIRCAGWVFGTGHPSTVSHNPQGPVDWTWYKASAQALKEFGGLADFHAYGAPYDFLWKDHLLRMKDCPYELPCVFSEWGIDKGTIGLHGQGWTADLSPEQYSDWLNVAQYGIYKALASSKLDLQGLLIFCYDTNSDWKSFSVNTPEMRAALENEQWDSYGESYFTHIPVVAQPELAEPPDVGQPSGQTQDDENFERAVEWVLAWEGDLSLNANDPGNYYNGELIGTKWGISAATWGGQYDIKNLTKEQAKAIYHQHYWQKNLPWPTCLLYFDTAVLHGKGYADTIMAESPLLNPWYVLSARLRLYVKLPTWPRFGAGWVNRVADLMEEIADGE